MNFNNLTTEEILELDLTTLSKEELSDLRKVCSFREKYHDLVQATQKILLNSLYGCLGNQYFVFYDTRIAEAITLTGQYTIRRIANDINSYIGKITGKTDRDYRIAGDTDSVMFDLSGVVEKYMSGASREEQIEKTIKFADGPMQEEVNKTLKIVNKVVNAYDETALDMERENVCDAAIIIAKKKYAYSIIDSEGKRFDPPDIKITGLDSKRSELPKVIRDKLVDVYKVVMYQDQDALDKFITKFRKEYMEMDVELIASLTGVNGIEKHLDGKSRSIPYHVKAAIAHNKYIKKMGLEDKISPIQSGDKIHIVPLKYPNPVFAERFAWVGDYHPEYNIDEYIDRTTQFEDGFISKVENITDRIGWQAKPKVTHSLF